VRDVGRVQELGPHRRLKGELAIRLCGSNTSAFPPPKNEDYGDRQCRDYKPRTLDRVSMNLCQLDGVKRDWVLKL
jgi:hypothetical protein